MGDNVLVAWSSENCHQTVHHNMKVHESADAGQAL